MAKIDYNKANSMARGRRDHDYHADWEERRERDQEALKRWQKRMAARSQPKPQTSRPKPKPQASPKPVYMRTKGGLNGLWNDDWKRQHGASKPKK